MKKTLFSVVAAFSFTLASAAFAQSTPTNDRTPPPPSGSAGSETTGAPSTGNDVGKTDTVKKTSKSKQRGDSSADKPGASKY
jgi:Ni/Co efflux regulator RcnB